ncbi:MAG TPA: hypothetical protein VF230_16820 [Acidimicrobiales bacterium]
MTPVETTEPDVGFLADDRLVPSLAEVGRARESQIVAAACAAAALLGGWKIVPIASVIASVVWWASAGFAVGVVAGARAIGSPMSAWRDEPNPWSRFAAGAIVPVAAAVVHLGVAAAVAALAVACLVPGVARVVSGHALRGLRVLNVRSWTIRSVGCALLGAVAGGIVACLVGLTIAPVAAAPVEGKKVTVRADRVATATGIAVAAGERISVKATGTIGFLDGDDGAKADADGYPARYSGCGGPGFCGVLVGRIDKGPWFLLGAAGSAGAPAAGKLELGVNDYDVEDNRGNFTVVVDVSAPSPAAALPTDAMPASAFDASAGRIEGEGSSGSFPRGVLAAVVAALAALFGHAVGAKARTLPADPPVYVVDKGELRELPTVIDAGSAADGVVAVRAEGEGLAVERNGGVELVGAKPAVVACEGEPDLVLVREGTGVRVARSATAPLRSPSR